ncbi:aldehyde dehydrogenase family protein [Salinisphaera sp. Q1T1-3]|uniref:aldehyde dehydrogenase family protein n=1 Tax=Salinisphaera sp. Q1T1-3 TaxID=2321229 RepID=UPI000E771811|nr:aldehyde dehydrogenase family protein [Salinisphaera sp. Q1T1-3]RJS91101.1 aldehyde dehydrogenase family protein [Salinisphaera sp. Q1T1-3]
MNELKLLIGGAARAAENGATFDRANPAGGDVVTRAAAAQMADAAAAAEAAGAAFEAWSQTGPGERRRKLLAAADALEARAADLTTAMIEETGATAAWAGFNVHVAAGMLREAAGLTTQIQGATIPSDVPGNLALSKRVPCGPVLGIAPWNAPVILGTRALATALACGNTVVLKASEQCPAVHHLIGQALTEAGMGQGVVNVVTNDPADAADVVRTLIEHPAIARVNFTGSTSVGRIIGQTAAGVFKPALLELGGKAPFVVADDADLDAAVAAAAFGAFFHQGQICMSTERLIVADAVADDFAEKLAAKVKTLKAGDPRHEDTPLGTLIGEPARCHLNELIEDAVNKGARLLAGGPADSVVMQPTVLDHVTPEMRLYTEESFGPVVAMIRVAGGDEALVASANDTEYGLSAAVFSGDGARGMAIADRIRSGICHINGPTVHDEPQMPFGGVKASGYGRFGGQAGIAEFTDLRWMTLQSGDRHYPI